ncbi:hypothetical protein FYJ43_08590 [Cutibacterium sp. WCA-380-WT-3A]|uniref:Uncharacterized protein n=1 Tax=Cutibacterium porci TaxID=2605781 RepID=A0A7K0J820_9ACTN|nr:hypothetical protein [Cutibacterium porci]
MTLEQGQVGQGDAGVVGVSDEGFGAVLVPLGVAECASVLALSALGGEQLVKDLRRYRSVGTSQRDSDEVRAPIHVDAILHAWAVVIDVSGELDPQVAGLFAEEVGGVFAQNLGSHDDFGESGRVLFDVRRSGFLEGCGHLLDDVWVGVCAHQSDNAVGDTASLSVARRTGPLLGEPVGGITNALAGGSGVVDRPGPHRTVDRVGRRVEAVRSGAVVNGGGGGCW